MLGGGYPQIVNIHMLPIILSLQAATNNHYIEEQLPCLSIDA